MSFLSLFRRPLMVALPALAVISACSSKDSTPAPDQGNVMFVNAASHIAPATLVFSVGTAQKASLDYGKASGYQGVLTGSQSILVASGGITALTQAVTVEKDKHYTFVAAPSASTSTVSGYFITDDLTAPATGKARVRVINLGQSLSTPIRLSQVTSSVAGPIVADIITNIAGATAVAPTSAYTDFAPGTYNLSILDANGVDLTDIGNGDGTGAGTGASPNTKTYEAGKIYTVIVSGTQGSLNQSQKIKAFLFQNN